MSDSFISNRLSTDDVACGDCGEKIDPNASNSYYIESENKHFCRHCRDNFITCGGCDNLFRINTQGGYLNNDGKNRRAEEDYRCDGCIGDLPDYTVISLATPPTQDELYVQTVADDKFALRADGRVEWLYFNPDGFDEKGQYVSNVFYSQDIEVAADACGGTVETFFDLLGSFAKQYLVDNDGGDTFTDVDEQYHLDTWSFIGCSQETMDALVALTLVSDSQEVSTQ